MKIIKKKIINEMKENENNNEMKEKIMKNERKTNIIIIEKWKWKIMK